VSGLAPTAMRDVPAIAVYFSAYEVMKDACVEWGLPLWGSSFVAGALRPSLRLRWQSMKGRAGSRVGPLLCSEEAPKPHDRTLYGAFHRV
jgi:hypothetical protein